MAGGTSAAAPIAAGIFTLLNGERLARGQPPMGFLNPWLCVHPCHMRPIVMPPGFLEVLTLHVACCHVAYAAACTHRQVARCRWLRHRCVASQWARVATHCIPFRYSTVALHPEILKDVRAGDNSGGNRLLPTYALPRCTAQSCCPLLVLSRAKAVPIRRSSERRL